jgi:hypothetical protein
MEILEGGEREMQAKVQGREAKSEGGRMLGSEQVCCRSRKKERHATYTGPGKGDGGKRRGD